MKTLIKLIICLSLVTSVAFSQVGIGTTTPDPSASLELSSTNSGFLVNRMTMAQRDLIDSPATGLLIYQIDNTPGFYYYNGTIWTPFTGGADTDWVVSGADMYNGNSGNVGIGTTAPTKKLHVESLPPIVPPIPPYTDFETSLSPLNTFGDANWFVQSTSANGGAQAAQSGAIGDNQQSILRIPSLTITDPGTTISFFVEVGSENGLDFLEFSIDNVVIQSWSGVVGWTQYTHTFAAAGTYLLKWKYSKDGSNADNGDFARVDDIVVTVPSTTPPNSALRIVDGNQGDQKVLMSDANGNASWSNFAMPTIATFQGMQIPRCNVNISGDTGSFSIDINGTATTVNWEVLQRVDVSGTVGTTSNGLDVVLAPYRPESLQVRYDFTPALPFTPKSIILTANNSASFPDNFNLNYSSKSANSLTVNITRLDVHANEAPGAANCWDAQFYFDVFMTN